MSFFNDVFGVGAAAYPMAAGVAGGAACGYAPVPAPRRSDFFERMFAPQALDYPLPPCATSPAACSSAERCAALAGKFVRAFVTNPEFIESTSAPAAEAMIETMTGEPVATRMIVKEASPIAFVVPEGCDAVDVLFGPVEVNPGIGRESDLAEVVSVGSVRFSHGASIDRPLVAGEQLTLTVPWRAASFASLGAGRLRVLVLARFYKKT